MRDRGQHILGDPVAKLQDALLVAGGAEVPALAGEGQEVFVAARITADPREAFGEVTAGEEFLDDPADEK